MQSGRLVAAALPALWLLGAAAAWGRVGAGGPAEGVAAAPQCEWGCVCGEGALDCSALGAGATLLWLAGLSLGAALEDSGNATKGGGGPFRGLANLQRLTLEGCGLTGVGARALAPLASLQVLDLRANRLRAAPALAEAQRHRLQKLFLGGNPLAAPLRLGQLPQLIWLQMDECGLHSLEDDALAGVTALLYLSLRENLLRNISTEALAPAKKLSHLHLEKNLLTELEPRLIENHTLLQTLYLVENPIQLPEEAPFLASRSLLILDLSGCALSALWKQSFSLLPTLRALLLARNALVTLPSGAFDKLTHLKVLDLRDNKMAALDLKVFSVLRFKVKAVLDVSGNPLGCECSLLRCRESPRRCFMAAAGVQWDGEGACTTEEQLACTGAYHTQDHDPDHAHVHDQDLPFDDDPSPDINVLLVPKEPTGRGGEPPLRPMHLAFGVSGAVLFVIVIFVSVWMARRCRRRDEAADDDDGLGETAALSWTIFDPDEGEVRAGGDDAARLSAVGAVERKARTLSQTSSVGKTFRETPQMHSPPLQLDPAPVGRRLTRLSQPSAALVAAPGPAITPALAPAFAPAPGSPS